MKLRLLRSKGWWVAHRMDMPDWFDLLWLILVAVVAGIFLHEYDTYTLRKEALFVSESAGLFKRCLEGRASLGTKIMEDGNEWREQCEIVYKRVEK